MIPLLHTAISERFRGAARDEALYKSTFTLLYFTLLHSHKFRGSHGTSVSKRGTPLSLNTVRGGLERLLVYDPGFNSQGWPSNLGQDHVRVCFEINFSDRKENSSVSFIICDC